MSVNLNAQSDRKFTLETIEKMKQPKTTQHKKEFPSPYQCGGKKEKTIERVNEDRFKTIRYNSFGFSTSIR